MRNVCNTNFLTQTELHQIVFILVRHKKIKTIIKNNFNVIVGVIIFIKNTKNIHDNNDPKRMFSMQKMFKLNSKQDNQPVKNGRYRICIYSVDGKFNKESK